MTKEAIYNKAVANHNIALKAYELVRDAYRAGKIDDDTFLAAQAAMKAASATFDEAYSQMAYGKSVAEMVEAALA